MVDQHGEGGKPASMPSLKHKALPPRPRAVLEAMFAQTSSLLELGLSSAVNDAEQQLFRLAEQARSNDEQNRCFEALREIRRGRADLSPRFMIRLEAALAGIGDAPEAPAFARMTRGRRNELSLVDPIEFEESLALQEIASKAEIRNAQSLFTLGQRFGVLAGAPAFEADLLPVGPHRLAECLREAAACLDLPVDFRVVLYRAFDRQCLQLTASLYEQLNDICVRHRVLPNVQFHVRVKNPGTSSHATPGKAAAESSIGLPPADPPTSLAPAAHPPHPAPPSRIDVRSRGDGTRVPTPSLHDALLAPVEPRAADPVVSRLARPMTGWPTNAERYPTDRAFEPDPRDEELFDSVRTLLFHRRQALGLTDSPAADKTHVPQGDELQAALGALQAKPAPPMMIGGRLVHRSISHLKQDLLSQLRRVTPEGKQPRLAESDADTFDLVAMLYEQIAKEVRPGSTVEELLTRLQVPLLRVALADKSFFTRRGHPARQLLNAVTEAGLFWLDDEGGDETMVERMKLVVDRAAQEYDQDPRLFEDLLTDLSKHLATVARKSEVAERRHVDAARGREKLELARSAGAEAIGRVLATHKAPAVARTLLEQAWTDVLALTALRQGEDSETYRHRVGVAERIASTLATEPTARDAAATATLRTEVEAGLTQVGYHAEDVHTVVERLFGTTTADEPVTLTELAVKLKARARLGEDADTTRPMPEAKADAKDGEHPQTPHRAVLPVRAKIHPPLDAGELELLEKLKHVPFGTWFEFVHNQQGDKVRRKLSWFSPVTGRCLFVNQRGARAEEKTLEQLARDVARGHANVVEATKDSLIDRAWNALMNTLSKFSDRIPHAKAVTIP